MNVDLDMSLVRAFIAAAEELHFGRAAERLSLSQQVLSKRISKLERDLGISLFERSTRNVRLTETGLSLIAPAAEALAAADAMVAVVQHKDRSLRVDILHERLAPALMTRRLTEEYPDIRVEVSSRRSLIMAMPALIRGEIDLAFGRVPAEMPRTLAHRIIRLDPLAVIVSAGHPLATLPAVRPADLANFGVWTPMPDSAAEWSDYVSQFAASFGCELADSGGDTVAAQEILERSAAGGPAFLSSLDVENPQDPRLRLLDLVDPVPVYPWSLVWRTADRDPLVTQAVSAFTDLSRDDGWCATAQPYWVPDEPGT